MSLPSDFHSPFCPPSTEHLLSARYGEGGVGWWSSYTPESAQGCLLTDDPLFPASQLPFPELHLKLHFRKAPVGPLERLRKHPIFISNTQRSSPGRGVSWKDVKSHSLMFLVSSKHFLPQPRPSSHLFDKLVCGALGWALGTQRGQ